MAGGRADGRVDLERVGHVRLRDPRTAAARLDLGRHGLELVARTRDEGDARTGIRERERAAAADPAPRPGDECVGAGEQRIRHSSPTSQRATARAGDPVPPTSRRGKNRTQKP